MKEEEGKLIDRDFTAGEPRLKTEEGELIDCGSNTGGPQLNLGDLRRAYHLRRYAHLRSCFVNDTGDRIT